MKKTDCWKEYVRYASLNVLGMLGLSCYILADTYFVSQGLGADGLAALNLAIPIYSFIHGSGLMIGMGGGTRYSIRKSPGSGETNRIFTNAVMTAAGFAVIYVYTGIFFTDRIVTLMGADASVFDMTRTYLKMILLFSPAFLMNNVLLCFVRILIYAGTYFQAPQISSVFNREQNETLQRIAVQGLRLYFTACPFVGFNIMISTYFASTARPLPANIISVLRGFVIIIPLAFLFSAVWKMTGIWCAFPCTECLVSIIGILLYLVRKQP